MRQILTILFLLLLNKGFSQEKITVGIMPFTYASGTSQGRVNSIQETVTNGFAKTKRFTIVDRTKMNALKQEKELQKSEDFIDGKVIQQGVSIGANFLISGHVTAADIEPMTSSNSQGVITVTYKAKLSIQLKVIDVSSSEVITSETIMPKAGSGLLGAFGVGYRTEEEAMTNAIDNIEGKVDDFVGRNFPISFSIVEIQETDSKGNATKILISGGSLFGLQKGDRLKIVEISMIDVDGKKLERKKEIAQVKVSKVEDDNFSTCSVSSGGIDIVSRFNEKAKLKVITKN